MFLTDKFWRNLTNFSIYRRFCVFDVYDRFTVRTHDHSVVNKSDITFEFLNSQFERL